MPYRSQASFWITLIIFYFNALFCYCFSWKSSIELWDLEYTGSAFIAETNAWTASSLVNPSIQYSQCGTSWLLGGYNILGGTTGQYFQRVYTRLPAHNQLDLTYTFFAIDSWDGNAVDDHYEVYVDGYYQRGWKFSAFAGYTIPLCGSSWDEFPPVTAYSTFIHSGTTLTLRFINMLDQVSNDESFGIREIKMKFLTVPTPKYSLCGRSTGTPLPEMACPCDTVHEYMSPPNSGTCFPCFANCNTCSGSGSNQCYSCYDGGYLSGTTCYSCNSNCKTCSGSAPTCTNCNAGWFMIGSICYPSCNYPFYTSVFNGVTYCNTPCPGQYVYWDQSCSSSCAYSNAYGSYPLQPVTVNTFLQCNYPCETGQFLYFNTSCLSTCPVPLTDVAYKLRNFCGYSCQLSQYLYWNRSCLNDCPYPLSPEIQGTTPSFQKKFCWFSCQPSQWLYFNQTCQDTCEFPFLQEVQGTSLQRNFCWFPCPSDQFLYPDGHCEENCRPSFTSLVPRNYGYCNYKCPESQFYFQSNESCLSQCPGNYFNDEIFRNCEACQDLLCEVCQTSLGEKCDVCQEGTILDFDKTCKNCSSLENKFVKVIDSHIYEYNIRLFPDSCNLNQETLRNYFLPTNSSRAQFPPFSLNINQTNISAYTLWITFNYSISQDNNLDMTLVLLKTTLQVPKSLDNSTFEATVKTALLALNGGVLASSLFLGGTAAAWSLIGFQQFIGYFAYINIPYPSHLNKFFALFLNNYLEFLPNPFKILTEAWDSAINPKDSLEKYQLPHKFKEFETPTLFIVNAGSTFFYCLIVLILPCFLDYLRRLKYFQSLKPFVIVHSNLRWNIPLRIFLESGIPLFFAILIQIRKITYANILYAVSTSTAILAFIYFCVMLYYIFKALLSLKKENLRDPNVEKSVGTLYEGLLMNEYRTWRKYYYLIFFLRGILLVFMDVLVDSMPAVQISSLIVFNMFFACYVWTVIEFESRYITWTTRIKEVLIMMVEVFIMVLYVQEAEELYKGMIGWIIIVMLGVVLAMEICYGIYLNVLAMVEIVKGIKRVVCKDKKRRIEIEIKIRKESSATEIETFRGDSRSTLK